MISQLSAAVLGLFMPPWQWLKVSKAGATSLLWLFQFEVIKIKWHLKCSSPVISHIPITQQQHEWNFPTSQKVLSDGTASESLHVFTTGAMLSFLHLIICHNVILLPVPLYLRLSLHHRLRAAVHSGELRAALFQPVAVVCVKKYLFSIPIKAEAASKKVLGKNLATLLK